MATHPTTANPARRRRKGLNPYLPLRGRRVTPRQHTSASPDPLKDALHIDTDPLTCPLPQFLASLVGRRYTHNGVEKMYTLADIKEMAARIDNANDRAPGQDLDGKPFLSHTGQPL